jgi:hypothetical protein
MIDITFAQQLKQAGLKWKPVLHDFFGIPERGMDGRLFVISEMLVNIDKILGAPVVAFQGASEWALDYLVTSEAVWLPREDQLRSLLQERLDDEGSLRLELRKGVNRLELSFAGENLGYEEESLSMAYGQALLELLKRSPSAPIETAGDDDIWESGLPGEQDV